MKICVDTSKHSKFGDSIGYSALAMWFRGCSGVLY
jgi:hypothetical protein